MGVHKILFQVKRFLVHCFYSTEEKPNKLSIDEVVKIILMITY